MVVRGGPGPINGACGITPFQSILRFAPGGPMSSRSQLDAYIGRLEGRLRLGALLRGAAILTSAALVTTLLLVLVANHFAFSYGVITGSRIVLLIALAFAVGFGLA